MIPILLLSLFSRSGIIIIPSSSQNFDLVKPGYYYDELEMTGGMNCTTIFGCSSRVCELDSDSEQKVCICYEDQARPDCSYTRKSNKIGFSIAVSVYSLFGLSCIPWFLIGYNLIGVFILFFNILPFVAYWKYIDLLAKPAYMRYHNSSVSTPDEMRKVSDKRFYSNLCRCVAYSGVLYVIWSIVFAIYVVINGFHDANGYGLF